MEREIGRERGGKILLLTQRERERERERKKERKRERKRGEGEEIGQTHVATISCWKI